MCNLVLKNVDGNDRNVNFVNLFFNSVIDHSNRFMNLLRRFFIFAALLAFSMDSAVAGIPSGYYDSCEGKTGKALLQALCAKIYTHTQLSYSEVWTAYQTTDLDENGKIWDMYSTKRWTYGSEQCGNYSSVGSCYNREHSFPKSWFDDRYPMYTDLFHLYPTDGKVNGQRGNYPFGECSGGTTLSAPGDIRALGRLGTSTFSGYTGTVFEPDDQYKGDFARSYFYMATCYNSSLSSWPGSAMLDGSDYPVFTSWATNLLLKWTRQDEVSCKELDRQEAVYELQGNRNPFIDHPELVEYIWGEKVGQPWYSTAAIQPAILQPVQNVVIDMGLTAVGLDKTYEVYVKTKAVQGMIYFSVYDPDRALTLDTYQITADQGNEGYYLTVTCNNSSAGTVLGALSVSADDMELEVEIRCEVVDGLPVYDATDISSEGFTVRWVNIGLASTYSLDVKLGSQSIHGFPCTVNAADEEFPVSGLEPLTTYAYQLSAATVSSAVKSVTTAGLMPSIDILFDGMLSFETTPGTPSEVAELLIEIENISENVVLTVKAPFELSSDKSEWSSSLPLEPGQDRFYMRVNSADEGEFETFISAKAGDYLVDDFRATAIVAEEREVAFIETFDIEDSDSYTPYKDNTTFRGTAALWILDNAGIGNQSQDAAVNGTKVIRFGNNATSSLTMAEDKTGGLGTVAFEMSKWGTDADPTVVLEYSADGGATWIEADRFTVSGSGSNLTAFSATVNQAGNGRIRFRQTAGKRLFLDNVSITDYSGVQSVNDLEYHQWDAFCRDGSLIVECREGVAPVSIYGIDGITWVAGCRLASGEHSFDLPKGLYIVVSDDFSRRVLVR